MSYKQSQFIPTQLKNPQIPIPTTKIPPYPQHRNTPPLPLKSQQVALFQMGRIVKESEEDFERNNQQIKNKSKNKNGSWMNDTGKNKFQQKPINDSVRRRKLSAELSQSEMFEFRKFDGLQKSILFSREVEGKAALHFKGNSPNQVNQGSKMETTPTDKQTPPAIFDFLKKRGTQAAQGGQFLKGRSQQGPISPRNEGQTNSLFVSPSKQTKVNQRSSLTVSHIVTQQGCAGQMSAVNQKERQKLSQTHISPLSFKQSSNNSIKTDRNQTQTTKQFEFPCLRQLPIKRYERSINKTLAHLQKGESKGLPNYIIKTNLSGSEQNISHIPMHMGFSPSTPSTLFTPYVFPSISLPVNYDPTRSPIHDPTRSPIHQVSQAHMLPHFNSPKRYFPKGPKIQDFQIYQKVGKGSFGEVFIAREKSLNFLCILKMISKRKIKEHKLQEHLLREIKVQSYLNHPHLTSFYGLISDEKNIYLIMEMLQDGSLQQANGHRKMQEIEVANVIKQVAEGLKAMHCSWVMHRDLKPQNLFVHEEIIKIGDFGCSIFSSHGLRRTIVGCLQYSAPEQLNQHQYSDRIDIWSLGILTYQLLIMKFPFQKNIIELVNQIHQGGKPEVLSDCTVEFPTDVELHEDTKDFIRGILKKNPEERMDLVQILAHPFLKETQENYKHRYSRIGKKIVDSQSEEKEKKIKQPQKVIVNSPELTTADKQMESQTQLRLSAPPTTSATTRTPLMFHGSNQSKRLKNAVVVGDYGRLSDGSKKRTEVSIQKEILLKGKKADTSVEYESRETIPPPKEKNLPELSLRDELLSDHSKDYSISRTAESPNAAAFTGKDSKE